MQLPPLDRTVAIPPPPLADTRPITGSDAVRGGITPAALQPQAKSHDYIGTPVGAPSPDSPSVGAEQPNRDWTEVRAHKGAQEPVAPPPEPPLYKLLIDQVQSLWRASAQTVDIAEEAQRQAIRAQAAANGMDPTPIVYSDPAKVHKAAQASSSRTASDSAS